MKRYELEGQVIERKGAKRFYIGEKRFVSLVGAVAHILGSNVVNPEVSMVADRLLSENR